MKRLSIITILSVSLLFFLMVSVSFGQHYKTMQRQTESKKKEYFQRIINTGGEPCERVTSFMFMGADLYQNGYWSVSCSNGGNWVIQIENDKKGSTSITPCKLMESIGINCWEKLDWIIKKGFIHLNKPFYNQI